MTNNYFFSSIDTDNTAKFDLPIELVESIVAPGRITSRPEVDFLLGIPLGENFLNVENGFAYYWDDPTADAVNSAPLTSFTEMADINVSTSVNNLHIANGLGVETYYVSTPNSSELGGLTKADNLTLGVVDGNASADIELLHLEGTLTADTFTFVPGLDLTILSGNGNSNFGIGALDVLDLSTISSSTVSFNYADTQGGGLVYNPGNGPRVFDAITLSDGSQILFEGIDEIRFLDGTVNLTVTPNDPLFAQQWNLHMMGVDNAWRFTTGSDRVLIGVQDSGLGVNSAGYTHSDLPQTTIFTENYFDEFNNTSLSHGTAVQGIIAASTNNGIGMSGINWNSGVYHIDAITGYDSGDYDLTKATNAMIEQANLNGQRLVINMSLGNTDPASSNPAFEQVVASNQDDVLFVIASGNDSQSSISYPASLANEYDNVIAVGASSYNGERLFYSNYGSGLTLMGPSEVVATSADISSGTVEFDFVSYFGGTSAAAPNVAGVASLVWSVNPNLTAGTVNTILSQTAYDLGDPGYDLVYGHGFVNADAAVRQAIALV